MNPGSSSSTPWLLTLAARLVWAVLVGWLAADFAVAQSVWELTPYRIQVVMAVGRAAELTPALEEDLRADLLCHVNTVIGAPWNVTIAKEIPPQLRRALITNIENVPLEALPEESLESDKVLLLSVLPVTSGYQVAARELDVRTQIWSTPVQIPVWQAPKLCDAVFQALQEAFAPLGRVIVEGDVVKLRLRAAGLPARDEGFAPVKRGDLFQPVIRYDDRQGNPLRINVTPWTFLSVERLSATSLECKLHSGLRSPLSGRRRGRVEQLALAVVPPHQPTRLTLTSRIDPQQLLAGYDIYAQSPSSKATKLLGRTDRQGSLMIQPGGYPLVMLLVKHGGALLARLPMVPGMEKEMVAQIYNDDQRLKAEGFLLGFEQELIDAVTLCQVMLVQAQARLKDNKLEEADTLIRQLRDLKTRDQFARELEQQKDKTFSADEIVQRRIDEMFANTQKALRECLDPKPIEQLVDELAKVRSAAARAGS